MEVWHSTRAPDQCGRRLHPEICTRFEAKALRLPRRENRKNDSIFGKHFERLRIDCRLREPHSLGLPSKAAFEILDSPLNLRHLVATVRQRKNHVVVTLREGGSMAGKALLTFGIGLKDRGVDFGA